MHNSDTIVSNSFTEVHNVVLDCIEDTSSGDVKLFEFTAKSKVMKTR